MNDEQTLIDQSVSRWCRRTAVVERVGPFEVFLEPDPFAPRYARPLVGARPTPSDVVTLLHRRGDAVASDRFRRRHSPGPPR